MENNLVPFHLAFPVKNLKDTKDFYTDILGCSVATVANVSDLFWGGERCRLLDPVQ